MRAVLVGLVGAVLAVGAAQALDGNYQGQGGDQAGGRWAVRAKISPLGAGRFKVNVQSTNPTCASEMDGTGILVNETMNVSGDCDLSIAFSGDNARLTEAPSCLVAHGASCEFSGDLRKIE